MPSGSLMKAWINVCVHFHAGLGFCVVFLLCSRRVLETISVPRHRILPSEHKTCIFISIITFWKEYTLLLNRQYLIRQRFLDRQCSSWPSGLLGVTVDSKKRGTFEKIFQGKKLFRRSFTFSILSFAAKPIHLSCGKKLSKGSLGSSHSDIIIKSTLLWKSHKKKEKLHLISWLLAGCALT